MKTWPLVIENDPGIRPAGKPDQCFYCQRKIGQLHGKDCVMVTKLILLEIHIEGMGKVGTYERYVPVHWNNKIIDSFFNGSSWCSDNCLEKTNWDDPAKIQTFLEKVAKEGCCTCSYMSFKLIKILDEGPFIESKE